MPCCDKWTRNLSSGHGLEASEEEKATWPWRVERVPISTLPSEEEKARYPWRAERPPVAPVEDEEAEAGRREKKKKARLKLH